jgi:hypothetical protein
VLQGDLEQTGKKIGGEGTPLRFQIIYITDTLLFFQAGNQYPKEGGFPPSIQV